MVRTPASEERVAAPCHQGRSVSIAVHRQLLHGNLGLGSLEHTSIRHQDSRATHSGIEHFHHTFLGSMVCVSKLFLHPLFH